MLSFILVMLSWFVDKEVINSANGDVLIEETEVECRPERVTNAVLDENVDIYLIRRFFSSDAWMIVEDVVCRKKEKAIWICGVCQQDLHSDLSIICECCLGWFHFRCVGLSKHPKKKNWFCRQCYVH